MSKLPVVVNPVNTPVTSQALRDLFSDSDFLNTVRNLTHDFQKKPVALNLARSTDMGDGLTQLMELDGGLRSAAFISEIINAQITFLSGFTNKLPDLKKALDLEKTRNTKSWQSSQANLAYLKAERYERSLNIFKQMKQAMQGLDLSTAAMGPLYALGIFVGLFNASSLKGASGQVTNSAAYSTAINSMAQAAIDSALVVSGLKVKQLTNDQALKPLAFYQAMDHALFGSVPIRNTAVVEQARRGQEIAYGVQFGVQLAVYAGAAMHAAKVIVLANAGLMTAAALGTIAGLLTLGGIGAIAAGATTVAMGLGLFPIALGGGLALGGLTIGVYLAAPIVMVSAGAALAFGGLVFAPAAVFAAAGVLALGAVGGALVLTFGLTAFVASGLLLGVTAGVSIYFAVQHFQQAEHFANVSKKYEEFAFNGLQEMIRVFNSSGVLNILMGVGSVVTWVLQPFRGLMDESLVDTARKSLEIPYGSFNMVWTQAINAEFNMALHTSDFQKYKNNFSSMLLDGAMDRVLILGSQMPGQPLRYMAAIIREGGTLPALFERDIQFTASPGGRVDHYLPDGLVNRGLTGAGGSVNIAYGGGSQYVVMEKISPSWYGILMRGGSGDSFHSRANNLGSHGFLITDDHTHTTLNLLRLSAPDDGGPNFLAAYLQMGAGNDTVIVGGRGVNGDLGDGFDGLDYSSAITTPNDFVIGENNILGGIHVEFRRDSDLVTVHKSGISTISRERINYDEVYQYGKRTERIDYLYIEDLKIDLNGTRDLFSSVEWIKGSVGFDKMFGNDADNFFVASDGASDTFQGSGGIDWVDYGSLEALEIFAAVPRYGGLFNVLITRKPHETLAHVLDVSAAKSAGLISSVSAIENSPGGYLMARGGSHAGVFIKDNLYNIENLRGGSWNDLIIGSGVNNVLIGNGGNDEIYGLGGDDFIVTHEGGSSSVFGGEGNDVLDYGSLTGHGIKVSVGSGGSGTVTKRGNNVDTFSGIEAIGGSLGHDTFTGSASDDIFHGYDGNDSFKTGAGNDLITTGRGSDTVDAGDGHDTIVLGRTSGNGSERKTLHGGSGDDVVYYENAAATPNVGIEADLSDTAKQWVRFDRKSNGSLGAGIDSLTNIEGLGGTRANDRIIGSEAGNRLWGFGGDDSIDGLAGDDFISTGTGQDTVRGGAGNDTILVERTQLNRGRYVMIRKNEGINERLSLAEVQVFSDGKGIAKVHSVVSSGSYDQGQHKAQNVVDGKLGGRATSDGIFASAATSGGWIQLGLGEVVNIDDIRFFGRTDGFAHQNGDFTIYVSDRDMSGLKLAEIEALPLLSSKRFDGQLSSGSWRESKTIDGGDGLDTVDYQLTSNKGIAADLSKISTQTVKSERNRDGSLGAGSTIDKLRNIENLGATQANDRIIGSASDNQLWGYGGNDFIDGLAGDDVISTGTGNDTVSGGAGNDTIVVERGTGLLNGRYVMVRKNEDSDFKLTLAEIEVWSGGLNEALGKPVKGVPRDGKANDHYKFDILVDGNTRGGVNDGIYRPMAGFGVKGWVQIDLGKVFNIDEIRFFGATDQKYLNENGDLTVYVSDRDMSRLKLADIEALPLLSSMRFDGQMSSGSWDVRQIKTIDGGDGLDTVDYQYEQATSNRGIAANLSDISKQSVQSERNRDGSFGAGSTIDKLQNIENLGATRANDRITGSDSDNRLWGYGGDDSIDGRAGDDVISTGTGRDTVSGGAGDDTILVERSRLNSGRYVMIRKNEGINERLTLAEVQIFSFMKRPLGLSDQSVVSSGSYDHTQHKAQNIVDADTGGDAAIHGIFASSATSGGWIQIDLGGVIQICDIRFFGATDGWAHQNGDFTIYVSDRDMSGLKLAEIEALPLLSSKRFDGQMSSGSWSENKAIDGGDGLDTVDYQHAQATSNRGIAANLSDISKQTVQSERNRNGMFGEGSVIDSLQNIENLGATRAHDYIIGSAGDNRLWGYGGDDSIDGRAGDDVISTGTGQDTVWGGAGDDTILVERTRLNSGRYVMIRKNENINQHLTLAEVEVWRGGQNVAALGTVTSSGSLNQTSYRAENLIDGKTAGDSWGGDGIFASAATSGGWIQIDLKKVFNIEDIRFFGRTDAWTYQNGDFTIYVSDRDMSVLKLSEIEALPLLSSRRFDGRASSGSWHESKTIDGGDGLDTVDYQYAQTTSNRGIAANLSDISKQTVQSERNWNASFGAGSTSDTLKNIENLGATRAHDHIIGSDSGNRLWGYGGDDFIDGLAGDDVISTGTGNDTVSGGAGDDTILVERTRLNSGRYVMIRKNEGINENLSLAEVQVFSGGKNIAKDKSLVSSGSYDQGQHKAQNLVDGNTGGALSNGIFASKATSGGWIQIDLGGVFNIEDIRFFGRTGGFAHQNGDFTVYVSDRDMSGLKLAEIEALPLLSSKRFDGQMSSGSWSESKTIDGGDGLDTVDYQQSGTGVTQGIEADLSQVANQTVKTGRNPDGSFASEDRLSHIENLAATDFNDRVIGSQGVNKISTFAGDDYIEALAGNDVIGTGSGKDTVYGGDGDDFVSLEHNLREIELDRRKVQIYADEKFVDGGAGIDFVSHRFQSIQNIRKADTGIVADLGLERVHSWRNADGTVNDKSARHTLLNIENVGGTEFGDALYGDANANVLVGYEGNDVLDGRLGNDTLVGGRGADVYELGANWGQDVIVEDPNSSSDVDVVKLSSDVSYADLWFSKHEDHLVVNRLGSSDQLLVQDWYSPDSTKRARVEEFRADFGGKTFTATLSGVETLVNVMSTYGRPSSPIATAASLTSAEKARINSAIATAWL
jgi:Ca2+-binding RTX toxin-like protein